jgi:hypothetical protein
MDDLDTIYADMEELRDDIAMIKRAYGGLSLPKHAHDEIRSIGYQMCNRYVVPTIGAGGFTIETALQVNSDFELTILDMCNSRLWRGVWKDAT